MVSALSLFPLEGPFDLDGDAAVLDHVVYRAADQRFFLEFRIALRRLIGDDRDIHLGRLKMGGNVRRTEKPAVVDYAFAIDVQLLHVEFLVLGDHFDGHDEAAAQGAGDVFHGCRRQVLAAQLFRLVDDEIEIADADIGPVGAAAVAFGPDGPQNRDVAFRSSCQCASPWLVRSSERPRLRVRRSGRHS